MPRDPRRPNPYMECSLDQLSDALNKRAGELLGLTKTRTPTERAELAWDTAMLLIALDWAVRPEWYSGGPEAHIENGVANAFGKWADALRRELRHRVLTRAAGAVIGRGVSYWLRDHHIGTERAYDMAIASDEGLQRVLEHLDEIFRSQKTRGPHR